MTGVAASSPVVTVADAVTDALPLAVLVVDAAYHIHYANAAAERLLNLSATALCGQDFTRLMPDNPAWRDLLAQTATHHGVKGYALPLPDTAMQEAMTVTAHIAACTPFADGVTAGRVVVLEHSAASEKLGDHASQQHAMRSAAVMAHILAHEVRNPLSGIKGAAQLLRKQASDEEGELLTLIIQEVERISGLMGQVEYFSTEQPIAAQAVNIHEVLRYVRDVAQQGFAADIDIDEDYDPSLPPVAGNRDLLVQAVLNLVKNAAEAAQAATQRGESPRITLRTAYRSGYRRVEEGQTPVNLPVCVQIVDNGGGIDAALRPHIFDPFVTAKTSGKGLGLPVVAKIIRDHGGVMALESAEPGHTCFALQLPAHDARA